MTVPTPPTFVYLDGETTGLSPDLHDLFELAWAVDDGPIQEIQFLHTLRNADPAALLLNGYYNRGFERFCTDNRTAIEVTSVYTTHGLIRDLTGLTIVAENYGFDCAFLGRKLGFEPWHYRKVELSSVAMTVFGLEAPEGLSKTAGRLRDLGYEIPQNDHTAAADVATLRACHVALTDMRDQLLAEAQERAGSGDSPSSGCGFLEGRFHFHSARCYQAGVAAAEAAQAVSHG